MALTPEQAETRARELHEQGAQVRARLDDVRRYWKGRQRLSIAVPPTAPKEVRLLARMARVNVIDLVVESLAQSLAVEGFRGATPEEGAAVWRVWQANGLDARQAIIHRATLAYGVSFAVVLPGEPVPVIRGLSPRMLDARYESDHDAWPAVALERTTSGPWRLYDDTHVHMVAFDGSGSFAHVETTEHGAGVTPVVRYLEVEDPDWADEPTDESYVAAATGGPRHVIGQVAPLMTLQDQVDLTTFHLLVAQHFTAHQQRYVLGWLAPNEETKLKMSGSTVWTFKDEDVKVGVIQGAPPDGFLKSRESSFRQVAALSQTPTHELVGELVNLSAEALAAAEAGRDRKVADRQTTIGEAHEQTLALAGRMAGVDVPDDAQVVWRDTSARSLAATVDALVKLAEKGVPIEELLERIPGMAQQDVERIRAILASRGGAETGVPQDT